MSSVLTSAPAKIPPETAESVADERSERRRPILELTVIGEARPQGSKIAQVIYDGTDKGRKRPRQLADGTVVTILRESTKGLKPWRRQIAALAREAWGSLEPLDVAMEIETWNYEPRPIHHYRTGRFSHLLKADAPAYPHSTTTGDSGKLRRGVEDALTGVVWVDDQRVVDGADHKRYIANGEQAFMVIAIYVKPAQTVADLGLVEPPAGQQILG